MLRNWQLVAAAIWAALAVLIPLRPLLFDADELDRLPVRNWTVANVICAFLALWNLARWYQARSARAADNRPVPLQPNRNATGYEYNPEFDFHKPDQKPEAQP